MNTATEAEKKKKYVVNLEGVEHAWGRSSITVPEIRKLAGWDDSQQIVEVNLKTNSERTLRDDESVTLKPGVGFAKKIKFQRG